MNFVFTNRRLVSGIDKLIWEQAKKDNPDPKAMIPVPMIGFNELHRRTQCQVGEDAGCNSAFGVN